MPLKQYDPAGILISIAGIPISGFADGQFVSLEWTTPAFTSVVGSDGEVTRAKSNDRRATLTLSLMQTSASNDALAGLAKLDRDSDNGAGVGRFQMRDINGTSLYVGAECWISQTPNVVYDREPTAREWIIEIAVLEDNTGGS